MNEILTAEAAIVLLRKLSYELLELSAQMTERAHSLIELTDDVVSKYNCNSKEENG